MSVSPLSINFVTKADFTQLKAVSPDSLELAPCLLYPADPRDEIKKEVRRKLEEFFKELDTLIKSGDLKGKTITIDSILAGSTERTEGEHLFFGELRKASRGLRYSLVGILDLKIKKIQKLGEKNGVVVKFASSKFLN